MVAAVPLQKVLFTGDGRILPSAAGSELSVLKLSGEMGYSDNDKKAVSP